MTSEAGGVHPNIVAILRDIAAADETSIGLVGWPTVQMYAGMAADEIERLRRVATESIPTTESANG